ncbi:MAG: NAD(P)-binding domain-containing protein [Alphaproteobacteria bacterium]|nr:NAD(P)-binding domain-containing protein [Alphaproteobacteria bacterium]
MDKQTAQVAVLGLGEMGAALARALIADHWCVRVWNRSAGKAEPFARQGVAVAANVLDAVTGADVVVVCVADYATVSALLHREDVASALRGKVLVQLTTRTPSEARASEAWAKAVGLALLEGAIQGYPMHIGTDQGAILYSGTRATFDRVESLLRGMTGQALYISDKIGSSAALDLAMAGTVVPGATLAFLNGAALCQAEGAPLEVYRDLVEGNLFPGLIAATLALSVEKLASGNYAYTGEGAPIDAWYGGIKMVRQAMCDARINPEWTDRVLAYLGRAMETGHGQSEMAAVFEQIISTEGQVA